MKWREAAVGSAWCLLASCSSAHGADPPEVVEVRAWLDEVRAALCERELRCEAATAASGRGRCHPDAGTSFWEGADELVRAGDVLFDPDAAARCPAEMDVPCMAESPVAIPACGEALVPTRALGERCLPGRAPDRSPSGCAHGLYCASTDGRVGTCVPAAPPGTSCLGRPCAETSCVLDGRGRPVCSGGPALGEPCSLGCSEGDCVDGRCALVPVAREGQACGVGIAECGEGTTCSVGICRAPGSVPLGEPCLGRVCVEGAFCDPNGRCAPLRALGEPCGPGISCVGEARSCWRGVCSAETPPERESCRRHASFLDATTVCEAGTLCVGERGRCLPIAGLGEACDEWLATCAPGARCVDWICRAVARPGEACSEEVACPTAHACENGRCTPLPTLGEVCDGECFRGACIGGRCALRPPGEPCGRGAECASYCRGVCGPVGVEGGPCGHPSASCEAELACAVDADGETRCVR